MKEQLISFETAKLAKEKGFKGIVFFTNEDRVHTAPTQSLLQKWLREEQGYHIDIFIEDEKPYTHYYYRTMQIGQYFTTSYYDDKSDTYEEALEKGLQKALKLI